MPVISHEFDLLLLYRLNYQNHCGINRSVFRCILLGSKENHYIVFNLCEETISRTDEGQPDRNIFSINVELTSTFLLHRGLVHHHHRILNHYIYIFMRVQWYGEGGIYISLKHQLFMSAKITLSYTFHIIFDKSIFTSLEHTYLSFHSNKY